MNPARVDRRLGRQDKIDSAGKGQVAFARPQRLAGQVQRHQRRRASGLDHHARSLQAETVGKPPGGKARIDPHAAVDVDTRGVIAAHIQLRVIVGHHAHEHARLGSGQAVGGQASMFERLPGDLEQQALLRVHGDGFARRNPKELRLELINAPNEAAPARVHLAGRFRVGVIIGVDIPAVGRHLAYRVDAVIQQLPVGRRIVRPAGKAAADPHNRDRLRLRLGSAAALTEQLQ